MPDQVVEITRQSWFSKIFGSFVGAAFGVLLFFGSFVVLWMNEGRTNWADVAASSIAIDAADINSATDGKFVAAAGQLTSEEMLGDEPYLQPGPYLKLFRKAEMYAWVEEQSSTTEKEVGGGSTTKTTYTYKKEWTSDPKESSSFKVPEGHRNPSMEIRDTSYTVSEAKIGAYSVDPSLLEMPGATRVALNEEIVIPADNQELVEDYIFMGRGTLSTPQIGDVRVSYEAVENGAQVTLFGTQQGDRITSYLYGKETFYRALKGDRASAIAQLETEYQIWTWILRLVGFLMMWLGLSLVFGPLTAFADVLPFLGNATGCVIGVVTFAVSFVLSGITIVIAIIAHSLVLLITLLVLIVGGIVLVGYLQRRNKAPALSG